MAANEQAFFDTHPKDAINNVLALIEAVHLAQSVIDPLAQEPSP